MLHLTIRFLSWRKKEHKGNLLCVHQIGFVKFYFRSNGFLQLCFPLYSYLRQISCL